MCNIAQGYSHDKPVTTNNFNTGFKVQYSKFYHFAIKVYIVQAILYLHSGYIQVFLCTELNLHMYMYVYSATELV